MWPMGLPTKQGPTLKDVAAKARQSDAKMVAITVEVSGDAGARKSTLVISVADLHTIDPAASLLDKIKSAVAAYERLSNA